MLDRNGHHDPSSTYGQQRFPEVDANYSRFVQQHTSTPSGASFLGPPFSEFQGLIEFTNSTGAVLRIVLQA